jgi:hypothetical protein
MENKFTPGKWNVSKKTSNNTVYPQVKTTAHKRMVDTGNHYGSILILSWNKQQVNANAKLIAAAPDLLETLRKVKKILESSPVQFLEMNECVNAAIKKAQ